MREEFFFHRKSSRIVEPVAAVGEEPAPAVAVVADCSIVAQTVVATAPEHGQELVAVWADDHQPVESHFHPPHNLQL